jgi:hypothetical protein
MAMFPDTAERIHSLLFCQVVRWGVYNIYEQVNILNVQNHSKINKIEKISVTMCPETTCSLLPHFFAAKTLEAEQYCKEILIRPFAVCF